MGNEGPRIKEKDKEKLHILSLTLAPQCQVTICQESSKRKWTAAAGFERRIRLPDRGGGGNEQENELKRKER